MQSQPAGTFVQTTIDKKSSLKTFFWTIVRVNAEQNDCF